MRRLLPAVALVLTGLSLPHRAAAQGEDATALRPGTLRLSFAPDWSRWNARFGANTPGLAAGTVEPLAVDFSSDSLGAARLPLLADAQSRLRSLTGLGAYDVNLGRARLTLNASYRVIPIGLELALSRHLAIGVSVPIVRARTEAFLLGPDTAGGDSATRGNVGFNPAFLTPGALDQFRLEVDSALRELLDQATSGPAALQAQAQATYQAIQPLLCGLYTLGAGNASSAQSVCFAPAGASASALLPATGTEAGDSVAARLLQARTSYEQMRTQYQAVGVTLPPFTAGYDLPTQPLDSLGLRRLFSDPAGPLAGDSLTTIVRTRLGDIETAAWFQLADRARWRSQLSLLVRLPTGSVDSPHNFLDLGTGDHQLDVELGLRNDLVLGQALWLHVGGRYGWQLADELPRRVSPVNVLLAPLSSLATLRRDLGDYLALDVVPRWQLDDAFSLGIGYHYYRQGPTRYTYADPADAARIGLDASVLDEETEVTRMRVGAGLTFSTLARHARGLARLPYTVTASFQKAFFGEGGRVPDAETFNLSIRAYVKLW